MSNPKITYLFGAGASCNSIPIGLELSRDLGFIFESIIDIIPEDGENAYAISGIDLPLKPVYEKLRKNLIALSEAAMSHASVDTLAKKLFLSDPNSYKGEFNSLKANLSAYFSLKQLITKTDDRYDAFYASVLEEHFSKMPTNFNILSWNYDKQFEIAYSQYDKNSIYQTSHRLNIISKFSNKTCADEKFKIIKLNGTAAMLDHYQDIQYLWDTNVTEKRKESLNHILKCYHFLISQPRNNFSALSFAWEEDFANEGIISKSIKAINNSIILVVIGYSFPFFNRKIDKQLLDSISPETVYVQDINPGSVISRIKMISPKYKSINMEPYSNVTQFLIPYEY
jgi:hypothetical protein